MEIKHIYWFSYYNTSEPSIRYRAKYPLEELKKHYGISYSLVTTGYDWHSIKQFIITYFSVLFFRKKGSIIVFQKIRSNRIYGHALKALLLFRKQGTLYDIDDPDYLKFSAPTIAHFIRNCETCSIGSGALMEYAKNINPNVLLLTSPVIYHDEVKEKGNKIFTIGWIGYYSAHKHSLKQLFFPALLELGFDVRLILLGVTKDNDKQEVNDFFKGYPHIQLEMPHQPDWSDEQSIYRQIKEFDIGVSPLLDTEHNRAKSAFKLKQYLSCGVPVLASPVGENNHFIDNDINGIFCNNIDGFRNGIIALRSLSAPEYEKMSISARDSSKKFSIAQYCDSILKFYQGKQYIHSCR